MKVSFKGDYKDVLVFQDKVTVVTLTGKVVMPEWCDQMPLNVRVWISQHPSVEVDEHWVKDGVVMTLKASGKAKLHDGDTFDAKTGERIAECRAKIRIYRFMYTLTHKLYHYYMHIATGIPEKFPARPISFCYNSIYDDRLKNKNLLIRESHHLGKLLEEL